MKKTIKRKGYMWKSYGFTKFHMWGVHITGSFFAAVGAGTLTFAGLQISSISTELFYKLIFVSFCAFLGAIAITLGSMLSLIFFYGAYRLGILEKRTEPEDAGNGVPPSQI